MAGPSNGSNRRKAFGKHKLDLRDKSFLRLINFVFTRHKIRLIVIFICIVISAIASTIAGTFLQRLVDDCIVPGMDQGLDAVMPILTKYITIMAIIYAAGVICSLIYNNIGATVTQTTLRDIRNEMFDKMQRFPIRYFDTYIHGDIMSTYTNDTDSVRQLVSQGIPSLLQSSLTILAILAVMLSYSIWLSLVVFFVIMIMFRITKKLGMRSATFMTSQQRSLAKVEGYIEEMMSGQKVVKVFNHEEETKKDFKVLNDKLYADSEEANKVGNIIMPILGNVGNLMYVVVAFVGGLLVALHVQNVSLRGLNPITIGIIVSFLGMSRHLSQVIGQMSMQVSTVAMAIAGAKRVFELIDVEPEEDEGFVTLVNAKRNEKGEIEEVDHYTGMWAWNNYHRHSHEQEYVELKGDVRFNNVDFSYVEGKQILYDVSLYAKPGQKIAFVGATGAGKTTITNLINRFYDIPEGKITYDGINITKIKKDDLRRSLGVVLQDVNLFTGTVMENIRYGNLKATDEECINAAKLANAHDFITRLPDGYDTMLTGNGSQLSQGQRQLLSIARAAVANPPVMILDEATSSIDTRTEKLVQDGMDNLMKGRTVFVIAHRLSTVRNSDAIMVLDHGHIIERGTHDELIAEKGVYYQLYTGAFELE